MFPANCSRKQLEAVGLSGKLLTFYYTPRRPILGNNTFIAITVIARFVLISLSGLYRLTNHSLLPIYYGNITLITSYFYYTQIQREAIKKLLDTLNKFIRAPTIGPLAPGGTALKASALSNIHLKAPLPATDTAPWHFEAVIQPSDTCRFCFPVRPRQR
jgi:hypothetical protein